eukprot:9524181-Alexandrium_andersonii.AAC.1
MCIRDSIIGRAPQSWDAIVDPAGYRYIHAGRDYPYGQPEDAGGASKAIYRFSASPVLDFRELLRMRCGRRRRPLDTGTVVGHCRA